MGTLVLVRHGESRWNLSNRFTGWVDVPLSEQGFKEAEICAKHCKEYDFDLAFTSRLERARQTLYVILSQQGRTGVVQHQGVDSKFKRWIRRSNLLRNHDLSVYTSERLNERYYGDLQGMEKHAAERKYGKQRVLEWRRAFEARPPNGESLKDTFDRIMPFFTKKIFPPVRMGKRVIVTAHGNTLRAIMKHLEGISDEAIADIDLPQAKPIVYRYSTRGWKRLTGELKSGRPLR